MNRISGIHQKKHIRPIPTYIAGLCLDNLHPDLVLKAAEAEDGGVSLNAHYPRLHQSRPGSTLYEALWFHFFSFSKFLIELNPHGWFTLFLV